VESGFGSQLQRPRPGRVIHRCAPIESRCSGPVPQAWLGLAGRAPPSAMHFSHVPATLMGFSGSFAVLLRSDGSADDRPTQPTCRSSPHRRWFCAGALLGSLDVVFPASKGPRDAASGFSRRPAVPRRRIGEAATAVDFQSSPRFSSAVWRASSAASFGASDGPACPAVHRPWLFRQRCRRAKPSAPGLGPACGQARPSACCRADV